MMFKTLSILCILVAGSQAGLLLGKNGLIHKAGDLLGIDNLVNVDANAKVNVLGNEVGVDGAVGIGKDATGLHLGGGADVLGQKVSVNGNLLDGQAVDAHAREIFTDKNGRQYYLKTVYAGAQPMKQRVYLDNGEIYVSGREHDGYYQHPQVDDRRIYDAQGGWWDAVTRMHYNKYGQLDNAPWDLTQQNQQIGQQQIIQQQSGSRLYDGSGGWWDLATRRYYDSMGQWVPQMQWDSRILQRIQVSPQVQTQYVQGGTGRYVIQNSHVQDEALAHSMRQ